MIRPLASRMRITIPDHVVGLLILLENIFTVLSQPSFGTIFDTTFFIGMMLFTTIFGVLYMTFCGTKFGVIGAGTLFFDKKKSKIDVF